MSKHLTEYLFEIECIKQYITIILTINAYIISNFKTCSSFNYDLVPHDIKSVYTSVICNEETRGHSEPNLDGNIENCFKKNKLCGPTVLPQSWKSKKEKVKKQLGEKRADEDAIEDAAERESQCMYYVCNKKMDEYI